MLIKQLYAQLRALWNWRRKESELDEEIQFHLSEEADERAAAGVTAEQAQLAARRDFGNALLVRERAREVWVWGSAERLIQDVRYALRSMRRQPGFSTVAVLTLALGIGATTAIFSVVNSVLLRPLPFPHADRIVALFATSPKRNVLRDTTSFPDFSDWQRQSHAFAGVAAYRLDRFNITGDGNPEPIAGLRASQELFSVLGVSPATGRAFDRNEQHGKASVAVISYGLWMRRYGGDPQILGRTILLDEVNHTVVGVLPPDFQFPPYYKTDVILPVPENTNRSTGYIFGVARLKDGVQISAAQQELEAVALRLAETFPKTNQDRGVKLVRLQDDAAAPVRTPLLALLGAALLVLLIGCGNVANLVLARGVARQRELAVRTALGASRARLVRQLLTESISVAAMAALLGSVIAFLGSEFLVASLSQRFHLPQVRLDGALLAFAFFIAVITGVLSGFPPALTVWRSGLGESLKQAGRGQSGGVTQTRLGNLLVVSQTALTVILLIDAGLLVKSFIRMQQIDIGLNSRQALTANLLLSKRYLDPARRETFVRDLVESVGSAPGVQEVAVHTDPPFMGGGSHETFKVEGFAEPSPEHGYPAGFDVVSGDFFRAMDIPILRGRDFDQRDTPKSLPVVIVNEMMARQFWPDGDAIGKRLRFYYDTDPKRWLSIVGVARDARYLGRLIEPIPQAFVPSQQSPYASLPYPRAPFISLVVRTANDPRSMIAAVRERIWAVDKDQPIADLQPMDQILQDSAAAPRMYMLLLGIFSAIALAIASAGIYGLSAYAVVRRTQEVGIRLALGATSGQILVLVLRRGMLLILLGGGMGVAGTLALRKIIARFLYGVTATDAPTFVGVLLLFVALAFLSTYIPARRAAAIDPTVALRCE
jgi:putative ABC transport system permease protein